MMLPAGHPCRNYPHTLFGRSLFDTGTGPGRPPSPILAARLSLLQQSRPPALGRPLRIRRLSAFAEHDPHGVSRAVVRERNVFRPLRHAVNFEGGDAATDAVRVLDLDVVTRRAVAVVDLELTPP